MKKCLFALLFLTQLLSAQKIATSLTYSVTPPSIKSNKPPVLIILHGYGSNENDFLDVAKQINGTYMTFNLRAPINMQGGSYCWYELNFLPDGSFKYDYAQVTESREKLFAFISNACKAYNLDSTQVYIMGFSQGAIMAYELSLYKPSKIKGILALSGRLMAESRKHQSPSSQLTQLNVFVAHGVNDERIKFVEADNAIEYLKEKKINKITFKKYNIGHSVSPEEINDIRTFLAEHCKH